MEEDAIQGTMDKAQKVALDEANNEQQSSFDRWERTGNLNKSSFSDAENPMENIKSITHIEPLSLEKSKAYVFATPSDKKTHGTLTVLSTSPRKTHFDTRATHSLATDSGEGSSIAITSTGSAKIELGSGNIFATDVSGEVELCLRESSNDEISIIKRIVNNNRLISSSKPLDNMGSASVLRVYSTPHDAYIKDSRSSALEAIYESNKNNNNNIDKPGETSPSVDWRVGETVTDPTVDWRVGGTAPSVDWRVGETAPSVDWRVAMAGNERLGSHVSQREVQKSSIHSSHAETSGTRLYTVIGATNSRSTPINTFKSAALMDDSGTEQKEASICVQSQPTASLTVSKPKQSVVPTASLTVSKPKQSVVLQSGTSCSTSTHKSIDSSTKGQNTVSPAYRSHTEPDKLALTHTTTFLMKGNNSDHWPTQSASGAEIIASFLNLSSGGAGCNETASFSTCAQTGSTNTVSQSNSFPLNSVQKRHEEVSDSVKCSLVKLEESKASLGEPSSFGCNKDTISPGTFTNIHHKARQSASFSANHPKSEIKPLTSTVHLSSAHVQLVAAHSLSVSSKDSIGTSSVSAGKVREAASASVKKPRSKNVKQKSQKATSITDGDDEDDNNDFIPVGMLQLSALKRPEGGTANVKMLSTENSQMNLCSNKINEKQIVLREGSVLPTEKPCPQEGNEFVQEKLKQKIEQNKLKPLVEVSQKQDIHLKRLAQGAHQHDLQQHKSQEQHQLLLKLVQHAQQQQKQLQDQQQHCHQSQNLLNLAISGLAKPTSFSKNQGLIIHHHQHEPTEVQLETCTERSSLQTGVSPVGADHSGDKLLKHGQMLGPSTQQPAQINYKSQEKNAEIEKSQKNQRYSQQHSLAACPISPAAHQQETAGMHKKDSQWQSSNIPKIAERLLQQSLNEQMLMMSSGEQLLCKTEQLTQLSAQQVNIPRSDQMTSRPITPTAASGHHAAPSVNQQHPEIARMLNSPVSPRQPASPRQSVSPRRIASPIQLSSSSAQFISTRQVATPQLRQPACQLQSMNSIPTVGMQPSSSYLQADQIQADSSQQSANSWQALNATHSFTSSAQLVSRGHSHQYTSQTASVQLPTDQRPVEQTRIDLNQHVSVTYERPQISHSRQQNDVGKISQTAIDGQHAAPDFSISLSSSAIQQLSSTQPVSLNQSVQSFSPGQIIHHRPPERRNVQNNVLNAHKSHSSLSAQLSYAPVPSTTPTVPSSKVSVPSLISTTTAWQSCPSQGRSSESSFQSAQAMIPSASVPRLDKHTQQLQHQQVNESPGQKPFQVHPSLPTCHTQLLDRSEVDHQNSFTNQTDIRPVSSSVDFHHQNQGTEKHSLEMQPSCGQYALPESSLVDTKLINSYVVSSAHDRNFQSIANLMEKESSLIQYLFANNSPVQTNERTQPTLNQTSLGVSQMYSPFSPIVEKLPQCEDSSRSYPNVICSYPELRKNEGGLKVLSEIASERYQLAVAGKDDISDLQADQLGYQGTAQNSAAEIKDPMSQLSASETSVKTTPHSNLDQRDVTLKTNSKSARSYMPIEDEGSNPDTHIRLRKKEAKSLTHSETPRREVRQRKPKKPFEQEDTPVKRSPKTQQQKSFNSQKQIFVTSTQNPSHKRGHCQKTAQGKSKEETEHEETKEKFIRQTRSAAEDRVSANKCADLVTENTEEMKLDESDPSRRLSKRLLVKEKEHVEAENSTKSRRLSRHSPRVHYKEDASGSVDESISARSMRPGKQTSISTADDAFSETPERMTTRSKNRNTEDKTTVISDKKIDTHKQKPENATEKNKLTITPSRSTQKATLPFYKVNKMDTRNQSKSPGIGLRSRSPVRSANAAFTSRRRAACQALAKLDSSKSGTGAKFKRPLPTELLEGLPLTQKRLKRLEAPKFLPKSHKPFGKIESLKEKASVKSLKDEVSKVASIPEAGADTVKLCTTKKQRQKKKKGKLITSLPTPMQDVRRPEDGDAEISNIKLKEEVKSQDSELGSNMEDAGNHLESTVTKSEMLKTSCTEKTPLSEETNKSKNVLQEKVGGSEYERHGAENSPEVVGDAELKPESVEQKSVIRSTTTVSSLVVKAKVSVQSFMPSLASAATSPDDKSVGHTTLTGERQKMVMYKLVPILENSMSDLDECLVPITGYYVPGGNNDRILLPHNFMHGPATNKRSSSSIRVWASLPSGELLHTLPTLPTCNVEPGQSSLEAVKTSSSQPLTCPPQTPGPCTSMASSQPLTCPPQTPGPCTSMASTLLPTVESLPTHLCTISSGKLSVWASHLPQTPPLSVGSPSSVVVPKKLWTSAPPQTSLSQDRSSPSWNATPSSSSPVLTSSSTWNSSSSTSLPPLSQQREQHQPWTAVSQQAPQESSWSSTPSATAAAIESWSKEFFPGTVLARTLSQRLAEPVAPSQRQQDSSSTQNGLQNQGYSMGAVASQQPQMYASSMDHAVSSSMLYNAGPSQDSEFADNRQDIVIQGYLRQVPSNPAGFSQELAGFNLGQHDLAYLENRLRQSLSPNTLFSAVAAYDDNSGHGAAVSHDNSLQESINLVHTVNLDMEEGHLDGSVNLDLADLGNTSATGMNVSRSLDRSGANRSHQKGLLAKVDSSEVGATDVDNILQKEKAVAAVGEPRADSKKPVRERKSQYEIIMKNDLKKYKCLVCGKNFGVATIYRHLRIHDPDYKVRCSQCGKQYTQQHSLIMHCWKAHGVKANSAGLGKSPKFEDLPSLEQESLTPKESSDGKVKSLDTQIESVLMKSPDTQVRSPSAPLMLPATLLKSPGESRHQQKTSLTPEALGASHDRSQLSRQQVTHNQVEELRRFKAEKKLAAAHRKAEGNVVDDGGLAEDGLHQSTSKFEHYSEEDHSVGGMSRRASLTYTQTDLSSPTYGQRETSYTGPAALVDSSRTSAHLHEGYDNRVAMKLQGSAGIPFQFNHPPAGLSTVPQFHADNIPKPISTPMIKGSLSLEAETFKETSEDGLHLNNGNGEGKHVCQICNTKLNTKSGYILHMRRHNKIKTKFCSYCNKGFHTGQELRSHERTHTGEKPYKCQICHTSFAHSGSFVSHKKGHEKRGEKDPFLVVDGSIQYPPTFKKPRLSGGVDGSGEKPKRVKKKNRKS